MTLLFFFGKVQGNENIWVRADLLYWKAHEKSLVLTNKTSPVFTTDNYTKTKVLHPHFEWDPGFRLGLGYYSPCSDWFVTFNWIHYQTHVHQKRTTNSNDLTNVNNQQGMFPIWSLSNDIIAGDYVSNAFLRGKIYLDFYDFDFGRGFVCLNSLQLKPYVGIRGANVCQRAHVKYSGGIFVLEILEGGVSLNGTDHMNMKNDFWGVGPRAGIAPRYYLGGGFSLYGDAAISGLWGRFHVRQKETYLQSVRFSHRKNRTSYREIIDLALGLSWKACTCDQRYALYFQLGWEYHILFRQLELRRDAFHLVRGNRNLEVQGITACAGCEF
jgi:hypothetical protein